jgi:hypothetical protein
MEPFAEINHDGCSTDIVVCPSHDSVLELAFIQQALVQTMNPPLGGARAKANLVETFQFIVEICFQSVELFLSNRVRVLLVPNMTFVRKPDTVFV